MTRIWNSGQSKLKNDLKKFQLIMCVVNDSHHWMLTMICLNCDDEPQKIPRLTVMDTQHQGLGMKTKENFKRDESSPLRQSYISPETGSRCPRSAQITREKRRKENQQRQQTTPERRNTKEA
ncbi:hypothetical protein G5714_004308 [Onychostoma macrolepis]|uniref:Uncharacterized protein n=1 Tax=Onychostoma macrolepis TaxID=369639 RepID=A0A7J6D4Q6_9TELE|nr:hypothetical protein G5714_004308 [Onychostoma macrolepis]